MDVSDALYQAVIKREHTFDGCVFIGIRTTGIVCFPSCRSRIPRRENIEAFLDLQSALAAGYRPCKRCQPEQPKGEAPDTELAYRIRELLEIEFPHSITLEMASVRLHVSTRHISRTLRRTLDSSLYQCWTDIWLQKAKNLLADSSLTSRDVAMQTGVSASYFSRKFIQETGTTPTNFRKQLRGGR